MKRKRERKKNRILTFAGDVCLMGVLIHLACHSTLQIPTTFMLGVLAASGMYVGSVGKYGLGVIDGIENAVTLLLRDRCVCIRGPQCQEREVQSDAAKEADRP